MAQSKCPFSLNEALTDLFPIDYLIIDVTDIKQETNKYRNSALTCQVLCGGKKIGDLSLARKDHELQIPLGRAEDNLQLIIFPMTNPKARVGKYRFVFQWELYLKNPFLGSVSIPVHNFLALNLRESSEQWFTLFDYVEDDIFDGVLGENDSEAPMVQIRYHLTDTPLVRSTYESRKEETVTRTTVTKTNGGVTKTSTTTTVTRDGSMESSDVHSVKTLTTDLRNGLDTLKQDLNAEQRDVHDYEDQRSQTLAHLENVHSQLEADQIEDQVRGAQLTRLDRDVTSEINIATAQIEDEKDSLKRQIGHTEKIIGEKQPIVTKRENEHKDLESTLAKDEGIKSSDLSAAGTELRKDNVALRRKIEDCMKDVKTERDGKAKVFNQHADLVTKYNDLVAKYEKLLADVETNRKNTEKDYNSTLNEVSQEDANNVNLTHLLNATGKSSKAHGDMVSSLRKDLDGLRKHYAAFETQLNNFTSTQTKEITRLENELKNQAQGITDLQRELSDSASKIVDLHATVDKENAANLNAKLSHLISLLVDTDKYRRDSQNKLENAQEGWTAKLSLFQDEAARMSRETANQKRAAEVEKLLHKLDSLNKQRTDIAKERDEMAAKMTTDSYRDILASNLEEKELQSLNLKLRWANDEIVRTHNDLTDLLKFLDYKRTFLSDQEEQLRTLRTEITEVRTRITECNTLIAELEEQLRQLNLRIEELLRLIAEKDSEIDELNRILNERLARIAELQSQLDIKVSAYKAVKGDLVDEMLAKYIQNCPVPVKRLGGGFYLFGLRKIYAKIMNGKLVIRVGGGYMVIEKFIETYADQELAKLERVAVREGVSSFMELDLEAIALGPKSPTGASPTARSPTAKSPKGASFRSSMNGTARSPKAATMKKVVRTAGGVTTTTTTTTYSTTMKK